MRITGLIVGLGMLFGVACGADGAIDPAAASVARAATVAANDDAPTSMPAAQVAVEPAGDDVNALQSVLATDALADRDAEIARLSAEVEALVAERDSAARLAADANARLADERDAHSAAAAAMRADAQTLMVDRDSHKRDAARLVIERDAALAEAAEWRGKHEDARTYAAGKSASEAAIAADLAAYKSAWADAYEAVANGSILAQCSVEGYDDGPVRYRWRHVAETVLNAALPESD